MEDRHIIISDLNVLFDLKVLYGLFGISGTRIYTLILDMKSNIFSNAAYSEFNLLLITWM